MNDDVIPLNKIGKIETVKVYNQAYVDKLEKENEDAQYINMKVMDENSKLEKENAELDCQKNRNKFCYSCANATERCFRNEIGCPCEKYKSYKDENAELKEKVSFLEDNLRVARKDREDLQLDVAKGLKEFVKDYPATAFRYLADEKYVEQITKAKEIIEKVSKMYRYSPRVEEIIEQAEQFLSEVEK